MTSQACALSQRVANSGFESARQSTPSRINMRNAARAKCGRDGVRGASIASTKASEWTECQPHSSKLTNSLSFMWFKLLTGELRWRSSGGAEDLREPTGERLADFP